MVPMVALLLAAACACQALAVAATQAATRYTTLHGAIQGGGDLGKLRATITTAEAHCVALADCVGFTFSCAAAGGSCNATSAGATYDCRFKSISATNADAAWWTWLKLPSAVTVSVDASTARPANKLILGCHSDSGYTHQPRSFYSQMVVGGSFEAVKLMGDRSAPPLGAATVTAAGSHGPSQPIYWNNYTSPEGAGSATLDASVAFHGGSSMKISSSGPAGTTVGVTNRGLGNEGLVFEAQKDYDGFFFAKSDTATSLVVALRDYISGETLASATLSHPGGADWQRLNFSFTPNASTTCSEMTPADTSVHCVPPKPALPGKPPAISRDHICVKCGGEVMVGLTSPRAVHIDFVFVQPGTWARLNSLPVLASTVAAMKNIGVSAIRQGGSFTDPSYYFWKRWRGPAWVRSPGKTTSFSCKTMDCALT